MCSREVNNLPFNKCEPGLKPTKSLKELSNPWARYTGVR